MIIVDYSGIAVGTATANLYKEIQKPTDQNLFLIRHQILNSIRSINSKFREEFGPMVIACDSKNYWRKEIFPFYKGSRKKARDKSPVDWKHLFGCISTVKQELKDYFPYRTIEVEQAEADDIIGVVTKEFSTNPLLFKEDGLITGAHPILIVSSDSDFGQLHKYPNVEQWSPKHKKYVTNHNPDEVAFLLHSKIMSGESGDGVPGVLSDDDTLVTEGKRQVAVRQKLIESVFRKEIPPEIKTNYDRNQRLIDFDYIPEHISSAILNELKKKPNGSKSKMFQFFVDNQLMSHLDSINDF